MNRQDQFRDGSVTLSAAILSTTVALPCFSLTNLWTMTLLTVSKKSPPVCGNALLFSKPCIVTSVDDLCFSACCRAGSRAFPRAFAPPVVSANPGPKADRNHPEVLEDAAFLEFFSQPCHNIRQVQRVEPVLLQVHLFRASPKSMKKTKQIKIYPIDIPRNMQILRSRCCPSCLRARGFEASLPGSEEHISGGKNKRCHRICA